MDKTEVIYVTIKTPYGSFEFDASRIIRSIPVENGWLLEVQDEGEVRRLMFNGDFCVIERRK